MDLISGHEGEIPIPMTTTYVGGHSHTTIIHENNHPPHSSNGPLPLSRAPMEEHHHTAHYNNSRKGVVVKYKECLKNHAASIGGNATDGCGEFMPSGEEGTLEALQCSACNCHRNFHRKEVEGEASSYECHHLLRGGRMRPHKGLLVSGPEAFRYPRPAPHQMVMPLGAALQASESDEMEGGGVVGGAPMVKKRFRTKFTAEQKERMLAFAEKVGWRLQKVEDSVVQQVCQEVGVKRRVLKVWMHNNKHNYLAKKNTAHQLDGALH